jgi:lysophospholipase L1-like esterase
MLFRIFNPFHSTKLAYMKLTIKPKRLPNHLLIILVILFSYGCNPPVQESKSADFKERGGANNIFHKLENQDTVKVAYLGGSITAQPGWRVFSREWLSDNYPETEIIEINAAIGGTGSPFGVYRLRDHVLQYSPDLVFVEFAVNDSSTETEKIIRSMEGIVHQIWQQNPEIDICFIYTIKEDFIVIYQQDSLPTSIITMEKIADHYQIPSINFGPEVLSRVTDGKVLFTGDETAKDTIEVFSPDGVHPYPDSGHKIYLDVFADAFSKIQSKPIHEIASHKINNPLIANPLVNAQMIDWTTIDTNEGLNPINVKDDPTFKGFSRYFDSLGEGKPEDSISFSFRGKSLGFFDVIGPGTGTLSVSIDGEESTYSRFDKYCTYWRISYKTIDGLEDAEHTVTFKVLDQLVDKKEILAQRDNVMEDEKDYEDMNWYLAKVMLDGDLIQ